MYLGLDKAADQMARQILMFSHSWSILLHAESKNKRQIYKIKHLFWANLLLDVESYKL